MKLNKGALKMKKKSSSLIIVVVAVIIAVLAITNIIEYFLIIQLKIKLDEKNNH